VPGPALAGRTRNAGQKVGNFRSETEKIGKLLSIAPLKRNEESVYRKKAQSEGKTANSKQIYLFTL
jgi:hypothetical protein